MLSSSSHHQGSMGRVRNISSDDFEHHQHPQEEDIVFRTIGEPPHFLKDSFDYEHFERIAMSNLGLKYDHDSVHGNSNMSFVNSGGTVVQIPENNSSTRFSGNATLGGEHSDDEDKYLAKKLPKMPLLQLSSAEDEHHHVINKPGRHYFAPHHVSREERMEYVKKVAKTLFTIFLVILMCSLIALDVISNTKNTWVIRLSIFVSMVILWRFLYEYVFEIILDWILEYIVYKENKQQGV